MLIVFVACEASSNPVVDGCDPEPVSAAGQIVFGQLFLIVNIADSPPEKSTILIKINQIINISGSNPEPETREDKLFTRASSNLATKKISLFLIISQVQLIKTL